MSSSSRASGRTMALLERKSSVIRRIFDSLICVSGMMITRRIADSIRDQHDHYPPTKNSDDSRTERKWHWIFGLTFLGLTLSGLIPPHRPGFSCDDPTIRKGYQKDSISIYTLFLGSMLGPILLFAVTEAIHLSQPMPSLHNGKVDQGGGSSKRCRYMGRWGRLVSDYMLGLVYLLAVVELGKVVMGELRPHFLDTCQPDWTLINCSHGVVNNYVCLYREDMPRWLKVDMFKSFPSGHAALSTYAFVFSSMYCQYRIARTNYSHLLRSWIQLLFLLWACICSLTRLTDNRHHWWDVMVGNFLGTAAGLFVAKCIVQNNFQPSSKTGNKRLNSSTSQRLIEVKSADRDKRTTSL